MWLKIKVPGQGNGKRTLWLPLFILWPFLLLLVILCTPLWLLVSCVLYQKGYGWRGFVMMPLLFETLHHMQGLVIEVQDKNNDIYLKFL